MTGPAGAGDFSTDSAGQRYGLRLYVTGSTSRSARAIENMRRICEEHLAGRYDLEVIDIYQRPEAAREFQLIAAPTLVPLHRDFDRLVVPGLQLRQRLGIEGQSDG